MNKPLKDWTLGEIKQECAKHPGTCCIKRDCPFMDNVGCVIERAVEDAPYMWDLSEPPRWTEQDKEDAKALKRLIPGAHHVWRCSTSSSLQLYDKYNNYILSLNNCFATLPLRESVMLDEIIGGAE